MIRRVVIGAVSKTVYYYVPGDLQDAVESDEIFNKGLSGQDSYSYPYPSQSSALGGDFPDTGIQKTLFHHHDFGEEWIFTAHSLERRTLGNGTQYKCVYRGWRSYGGLNAQQHSMEVAVGVAGT